MTYVVSESQKDFWRDILPSDRAGKMSTSLPHNERVRSFFKNFTIIFSPDSRGYELNI